LSLDCFIGNKYIGNWKFTHTLQQPQALFCKQQTVVVFIMSLSCACPFVGCIYNYQRLQGVEIFLFICQLICQLICQFLSVSLTHTWLVNAILIGSHWSEWISWDRFNKYKCTEAGVQFTSAAVEKVCVQEVLMKICLSSLNVSIMNYIVCFITLCM
jgi:hypothetical protein